jgi:hypothetical protein
MQMKQKIWLYSICGLGLTSQIVKEYAMTNIDFLAQVHKTTRPNHSLPEFQIIMYRSQNGGVG